MPTPTARSTDHRVTETPNAVMTTLASPTLGGSAELSLWTVAMDPDSAGPPHVFDVEQLWSVTDGELSVEVGGDAVTLRPGDTLVLPAGVCRRISAPVAARAIVCGRSATSVSVPGEETPRGTPPWIA